ncbi:MAG: amphi-Trp domain-containing protein [Nitrospirota bacterium]
MKEKISQRLSREQLVAKLRELAGQMEKGAVSFGDRTIGIPDSTVLTLEWKEKYTRKKLEIEIEW